MAPRDGVCGHSLVFYSFLFSYSYSLLITCKQFVQAGASQVAVCEGLTAAWSSGTELEVDFVVTELSFLRSFVSLYRTFGHNEFGSKGPFQETVLYSSIGYVQLHRLCTAPWAMYSSNSYVQLHQLCTAPTVM